MSRVNAPAPNPHRETVRSTTRATADQMLDRKPGARPRLVPEQIVQLAGDEQQADARAVCHHDRA